MRHTSIILNLGMVLASAFAHETHNSKKLETPSQEDKLNKINEAYVKQVKPIFQAKCFDCHSQFTKFPWYYSFPLIKSAIDNDIQEAKRHFDFSDDFPFRGHGIPREDIQAIQEVIQRGTMPPLRYRILHLKSKVTLDEKEQIMKWIVLSNKLLEN